MSLAVRERGALRGIELARTHGTVAAIFVGSALITSYFGFEQGGFFPGSIATVTIALALCLVIRVVLVSRPFATIRWPAAATICALGMFATLSLLSSSWSHAPGRAVLEFNRPLFYLTALVLFASLGWDDRRLAALAAGFAVGTVILCGAGFLTRTLPTVFPLAPSENTGRLGFPLTYRNAMGLTATLGLLVCIGLAAARSLPRPARVLASVVTPLLAATLLLTFSRGAIAAGVVGLIVICATGRSRSLVAALLAAALASTPAIVSAYSATALAQSNPTGPRAVSEGHQLALIVGLCCLGAGAVRFLLLRWEPRRRDTVWLSRSQRRVVLAVALVATATAIGIGAGATDLPHQLSRQYHQFVVGVNLPSNVPLRDRLLNVGNNGRLPLWRVAVDQWQSAPLLGHGAGTYQELWDRHRPTSYSIDVVNAHSLYLEVLAELGIVGLLALLFGLLAIFVALARRRRTADRALIAALIGTLTCWLLHAGVDWDWQMPANCWWVFAVGGLCLSGAPRSEPAIWRLGQWRRLLIAAGIAAAAILPLQVKLSQSHLDDAVAALQAGNCQTAVSQALGSVSALSARAEPYEILGYCDARYGLRDLSVAMIQNAINRDPRDWEYHYDMALVRGFGGLDPRPEATRAVALNPLSPVAVAFAKAVNTSDATLWRSRARRAHLLIP